MIIIYIFLIFFILLVIFDGEFRKSIKSIKKYIPRYSRAIGNGNPRRFGVGLGIVKGREFFNNPAISKGDPSRLSIPITADVDEKGIIQGLNIGGYKVPMDSIPPEINIDFKHHDQVQSVIGNQIEPMVSGPKFEKGAFNTLCGVGRNIESIEGCREAIKDLNITMKQNLRIDFTKVTRITGGLMSQRLLFA